MMLLARSIYRDLRGHPWQSLLSILGIALGVAVVLAVDLANYSASRAMQWSQRALSDDVTHQLFAGPGGLPERFYVHLRKELGIRGATPVVQGQVRLDGDEHVWQLWGIDVLSVRDNLAVAGESGDASGDWLDLISDPSAAVLLGESARRLGIRPGDHFSVVSGARAHELRLAFAIRARDSIRASMLARVIITDIAAAQEVLAMTGVLSRIDLDLDSGEQQRTVRDALPQGVQMLERRERSSGLAQMTDAFQLNLFALSLLALLLGAFLIFNTMTLSVLRRRRVMAVLRAIGVRRSELFALLSGEALVLGALGTFLGILLGTWLSQGLLVLVTRTINDLYFNLELQRIALDPLPLLKAAALGLGASLFSTLGPALEATRTPPGNGLTRAVVEQHARHSAWRWLPAAAVAALLSLLLLVWSGRSLLLGFTALFTIIAAFALSAPAALLLIVRTARPWMTRWLGLSGAMASRGVTASLSRTRVAVAALALAVATTVAVTIMIDSFRNTVSDWLQYYLRADIYMARDPTRPGGIAPGVVQELRKRSETAAVYSGRWVKLATAEPTNLFAVDIDERGFAAYRLLEQQEKEVWPAFAQQQAVIISEPFAFHRRVATGQRITLPTDEGQRSFVVAAVFEDYGSDRGVVVMHRDTYRRYWHDNIITSLAVYLKEPGRSESVVNALQREFHDQGLKIRSNHTLKELSLSIFDRTFVVTNVLRLLAIVIAVIGIFSALLAIQLERGRELAVLRVLGLTPADLRRVLAMESGLVGLSAGLLAIPLGVILAEVLVLVINRRAFGWSLNVDLSAPVLLGGVTLAVAAGILAGWYPAWRMARTPPAAALRYE